MTSIMPPDLLRELEDLGIPYGKVSLTEHKDTWENTAKKLIRVLWQILGDYPVDIEHVGSTAIQSIPAKPVLDIAVGVSDLSLLESYRKPLSENGIRIVGELNPGQIMCDMTNTRGLECVHIHFLPHKTEAFLNYLAFRDYLNRSPAEAKIYAAQKKMLAARFAEDRPHYTAGKNDLIKYLLHQARG